jgi:Mg2+ and Co2+ transporter CorA
VLGFFFLPLTTLAYAWAMNSKGSVSGLYLVVVILAVLTDLAMAARARRKRQGRG